MALNFLSSPLKLNVARAHFCCCVWTIIYLQSSSPPGPGLSSKMDDKAVLECLFQNEAKALAESLAWQREQRQILLDAQREAIRALFVKDHGVDSNGIEVRDEDGDGEGHDESGPVLLPRTPKVRLHQIIATKMVT